MEPEEIDKLFRDKLAGLPAVPSPDAWMRLQQKMEPPKKERTMWIYYAAASVVILLISGMLYFKNGTAPAGPAVATVAPVSRPATSLPVEINPETRPEINQEPESQVAQAPLPAAATVAETGKSRSLPLKRPHQQRVSRPNTGLAATTPALAAAPTPAQAKPPVAAKAPQPAPAVNSEVLASAAPAFTVVEVVVKRGPEGDGDEEKSFREHLNRKGQMLKTIYKQARNLKNGEPVELAALGVDKDKIQAETKELKQKLFNVISL